MGFTGVKIEDDKALQLCRERKRLIKQALDGRCSLAETHVLYIQSLRNTGTALRKLVEPEAPSVSSLYTSTSATPEPPAFTEKSISHSHLSYSSPSHSQHVEASEQFSPVPSPLSSGRFHVNHMKAGRRPSTIIEQKPPINATATIQQASETPKSSKLQSDGHLSPDTPSTPPWDYFDIFHPIDSQFSFHDGRSLEQDFDNADDLRRLREEEGIPELEEDRENASRSGNTSVDSEDDFEQPSPKNLVRKFKNHNEVSISRTKSEPPISHSSKDVAAESDHRDQEKIALANGVHGSVANSSITPSKSEPSLLALPMNGKEKEIGIVAKVTERDFISCMKDIEDLFLRASDSGKEVPRMLEANRITFRALFPEEKARRAKAPNFFSSCFTCIEGTHHPQVPAPNEEVKYLTWHNSASSLSSSSRIPLAPGSKDDSEDFSNSFGGLYMNSGSHASTLDRLFAWEKKLYDEVKACGLIRRDYDMKCRELREEESKGVISPRIDKIRAAVKDLHTRIQVAIHRIDSISKRIEEVRDKELQPQLEELIGGLTRMWMMMLDCHNNQYNIVRVARKNGSMRISLRSESHRQAIFQLESELSSLSSNFTKWISAHKDYLLAINGWLLKGVFLLKQQKSSRRRRGGEEFDPKRDRAPPIFITCKEWLDLLDNMPIKDVEVAIKQLINVVSHNMPPPEKTRGKPKLSLSLSRKASGFNELGVNIPRNEVPDDCPLDLDSLQVSLENLLANLKAFAERSVEKYGALQEAIDSARDDYGRN